MARLSVRKVGTAQTWVQRLTIRRARTDNSIGCYPAMSLAEACTAVFGRWKTTKASSQIVAPTFAEAAETIIAMREPTWRSPNSGHQWRAGPETCVSPSIGKLSVSEVTLGRVMAILLSLRSARHETTRCRL